MARYSLPFELSLIEGIILIVLFLLVLILTLIDKRIRKKRKVLEHKSKENKSYEEDLHMMENREEWVSKLCAISGAALFFFMFLLFVKENEILLGIIFLIPTSLMVLIPFGIIAERKQKERQNFQYLKKDKLVKETTRDIIEIYDIKNKVRIYLACDGKGIKDDPFIIDSSVNLPESFKVWGNFLGANTYYIIKDLSNCKISLFSVFVSIKNCNIDYLKLFRCPDSTLKNIEINNKIILEGCEGLTIETCNIAALKLKYSYENTFRNCNINLIKNFYSRANDFEGNIISDKQWKNLEKTFRISLANKISVPCIAIIIVLIYYFFIINLSLKNPILGMISTIIFIGIGVFGDLSLIKIEINASKKLKAKYPPNIRK